MRTYYAYISNRVDPRDDDLRPVRAKTRDLAWNKAHELWDRGNNSVTRICTKTEVRRFYPEWAEVLWPRHAWVADHVTWPSKS